MKAARRALRRSTTQQRRFGDAGAVMAHADRPPSHRTRCGGGGNDVDFVDAAEVADSEHRADAEILTSLVSKLRNFLVVNNPQNGVENSLRRFDAAPLPALTPTYS